MARILRAAAGASRRAQGRDLGRMPGKPTAAGGDGAFAKRAQRSGCGVGLEGIGAHRDRHPASARMSSSRNPGCDAVVRHDRRRVGSGGSGWGLSEIRRLGEDPKAAVERHRRIDREGDGVLDTMDDDSDQNSGRPKRSAAAFLGAFLLNVLLGTLYCWSCYLVPLEQALGVGRGLLSGVFSLATICFTVAVAKLGPWLYAVAAPRS